MPHQTLIKPIRVAVKSRLTTMGLCGLLAFIVVAVGCSDSDSEQIQPNQKNSVPVDDATDVQNSPSPDAVSASSPDSTRNQNIDIDWKAVDSGVKPVKEDDFEYPFALDSQAVDAQATFSKITPEQAQRSLTVGIASNEPLDAVLTQLGDSYVGHRFLEDSSKLVIYTTPNVTPSQFDYVIKDEFAHGLVLPIEVKHQDEHTPRPKAKTDAAHLESTE